MLRFLNGKLMHLLSGKPFPLAWASYLTDALAQSALTWCGDRNIQSVLFFSSSLSLDFGQLSCEREAMDQEIEKPL